MVLVEGKLKRALSIIDMFDFIEVRLDLCGFKGSQIREVFLKDKEMIATFREDSNKATAQKMDQLKIAIELGVKYVDLELDLDSEQKLDLMIHARGYGAKVILSYHNYDKTPSLKELKDIIVIARGQGANIVKIVTKVNFRDDCLTLFNLYHGEENLIAFGMGADAKFTRLTSLFLGAPFTYIHYLNHNKTVEGQLGYKEFDVMMKNLC